MKTIKVWVKTDKVGSQCEDTVTFEDEDWDAMTEEEREEALREEVWNMAEWGWDEE